MSEQQLHPPQINVLNHIAIEVNDIHKALSFYLDALGLTELATPEDVKESGIRWIDLRNGQALHLVENREASAANIAHFAITVDDVEAWRTYLKGKGVEIFSPKIQLYNAERFFLKDPAGNRIELVKWLD
jgi:catechol 2,3-dioxygenase-like lactoylglutathione lyase family enzyme